MKKLPNTIRVTRAWAGEPKSYSEKQFQEIIKQVGSLPRGKVLYQGHFVAFHIFGEEFPELAGMWHQYMHDGPLEKRQMTRGLALRCHIEGAAHEYKKDRESEGSTIAQKKKYLKALHAYSAAVEKFKKKEQEAGKDLSRDKEHLQKLRTALDKASSQYKYDESLKERTPSQKLAYYAVLERACNTLIEGMDFLESQGRLHFGTPGPRGEIIRQEADRVLASLQDEMLKQKENCSKRKIPRDARHQQDVALHNLVLSLCRAWEYIVEKKISPGNAGGSPLIRFIQSAIVPLGIRKTPNAVRQVLKNLRSDQKI